MSKNTMTPTIAARVEPEVKDAFNVRCQGFGTSPSDMLREMVVAFNEGRLRITVPKSQTKLLKGLHYVN